MNTEETKEVTEKFWELYDRYTQSGDLKLHPELSTLLAKIEKKERRTQLLRPEKGWNKVIAWQALRQQEFFFMRATHPWYMQRGEIILWQADWDRDVLACRQPREDLMGLLHILHPGYIFTWQDRENVEEDKRFDCLVSDECGLYLPLYEPETVKKLFLIQLEEIKEARTKLFDEEFDYLLRKR